MLELNLSNSYKKVLIDDDDISKVSEYKWHLSATGYVVINKYLGNNKWKGLKIHRLILGAKEGEIVDHINGDRLDNRKSNLRLATALENARNVGIAKNNTTGFKGVSLRHGKYQAHIRSNGKLEHIGTFSSAIDAAKAYNIKAEEYFKEFARLNDVDHSEFVIPEKKKKTSQYFGVTYIKRRGKWNASVKILGKNKHIGNYCTEYEAAIAYDNFLKVNNINNKKLNFGE